MFLHDYEFPSFRARHFMACFSLGAGDLFGTRQHRCSRLLTIPRGFSAGFHPHGQEFFSARRLRTV